MPLWGPASSSPDSAQGFDHISHRPGQVAQAFFGGHADFPLTDQARRRQPTRDQRQLRPNPAHPVGQTRRRHHRPARRGRRRGRLDNAHAVAQPPALQGRQIQIRQAVVFTPMRLARSIRASASRWALGRPRPVARWHRRQTRHCGCAGKSAIERHAQHQLGSAAAQVVAFPDGVAQSPSTSSAGVSGMKVTSAPAHGQWCAPRSASMPRISPASCQEYGGVPQTKPRADHRRLSGRPDWGLPTLAPRTRRPAQPTENGGGSCVFLWVRA